MMSQASVNRVTPITTYATRAMTLVEIMVVVVILGVLASVLVVNLLPKTDSAKHHLAKTQLSVIVDHMNLYVLANKQPPASGQGLQVLTSPMTLPSQDYFIKPDQLIDPWGNPFQYRQPGSNGFRFEIICLGADGQPGGEGVNADISSTK